MEAQTLIKISLMIDKMDIDLTAISGKDNEEVGALMINILIKNIHKAEQELYEVISLQKGISLEEAKKVNVIKFIKDLMSEEGLKDFLA